MTTSPLNCDVVIVGGGVVGLAAAAQIQASNNELKIIVVDPALATQPATAALDLRVVALTPQTIDDLAAIHVWKQVPPTHRCAFSRMRVWDAATDVEAGVDFNAREIGVKALGYIVDNAMLRWQMQRHLQDNATLEFIGESVTGIEINADHARVLLASDQAIIAKLIVGADGRSSRVREFARLGKKSWSHEQSAVVAHFNCVAGRPDTAWQRFLPGGPLALLPLPREGVSLVWSCAPERAQQLLALSDDEFVAQVSRESGNVLGELSLISARAAYPLQSQYAQNTSAARVVLIGDAAHAIHPLAGQGANLGFADARVLAQVLEQALRQGEDVGDATVLRRFARARKADNLSMLFGLDFINRLFKREHGTLAQLRRHAMRLFGQSKMARKLAASHAMESTL